MTNTQDRIFYFSLLSFQANRIIIDIDIRSPFSFLITIYMKIFISSFSVFIKHFHPVGVGTDEIDIERAPSGIMRAEKMHCSYTLYYE